MGVCICTKTHAQTCIGFLYYTIVLAWHPQPATVMIVCSMSDYTIYMAASHDKGVHKGNNFCCVISSTQPPCLHSLVPIVPSSVVLYTHLYIQCACIHVCICMMWSSDKHPACVSVTDLVALSVASVLEVHL